MERIFVQIYDADNIKALNKPTDAQAEKRFYEAIASIARLYDLEGLSKQDDDEALASFEKALSWAAELPDKVLYSRIKIHIARLAPRLHLSEVDYYKGALAPLDALDLASLDPLQCSDIVNLKLTCYYHLGKLNVPNSGKAWHEEQIELAKEYGWLDFQILGHLELADIAFKQGCKQTSADQLHSFQTAFNHVKQAWLIHEELSEEEQFWSGSAQVVKSSEIAQLSMKISSEFIGKAMQQIHPPTNPLP